MDLTAKVIRISYDSITALLHQSFRRRIQCSSSLHHCYRPAQHRKQLIPQNFQPYSRQNNSLSIISVQKGILLRLVQGEYEDNKASVTDNNIH